MSAQGFAGYEPNDDPRRTELLTWNVVRPTGGGETPGAAAPTEFTIGTESAGASSDPPPVPDGSSEWEDSREKEEQEEESDDDDELEEKVNAIRNLSNILEEKIENGEERSTEERTAGALAMVTGQIGTIMEVKFDFADVNCFVDLFVHTCFCESILHIIIE